MLATDTSRLITPSPSTRSLLPSRESLDLLLFCDAALVALINCCSSSHFGPVIFISFSVCSMSSSWNISHALRNHLITIFSSTPSL